ncbi:MerR family transcriptional regulator [Bacillus sp. SCS-151]|uniref:MerR family transcriptional regulator n=1 Tax=Nanhaiella sioensis TaxID=3115293 RepID=UPI0039793D82
MDELLAIHTISEVSKRIDVPEGTIRQWEKDFDGLLVIPRDKKKARYYTHYEIELLLTIKEMREKGASKPLIREFLEKNTVKEMEQTLKPIKQDGMNQNEAVTVLREIQNALTNFEEFKNDLREELKNEVIAEVRRELASASEQQQKQLETGEFKTSEQIKSISKTIEQIEANYKADIKKRDEELMESLRENQILKKQQVEESKKKGWRRFFQ